MKKLLFILLCWCSTTLMAQSPFMREYNYKALVTRSPEAAGIARFGDIPMNSSTGVPDISIPLETVKLNDKLELPISINYHASGLRIDDVTGIVGLKWSLFAGGSVDRDINGADDNDYYFANYASIPSLFTQMRDENSYSSAMLRRSFIRNMIDMNQDSYSYSFLGMSDNIYFHNGVWRSEFQHKDFSIQKNGRDQFVITDGRGNTYYFGKNPDNGNLATGLSSSISSTLPAYLDPDDTSLTGGITSWKLMKIKDVNQQSMNLEYGEYFSRGYERRGSDVGVIGKDIGFGDPALCGCNTNFYANYVNSNHGVSLVTKITGVDKIVEFYYINHPNFTIAKLLDRIMVKNLDGSLLKKITFSYAGVHGGRAELTLSEVRIYDKSNIEYQKYAFEYNPAHIPDTQSLDKDMFGYYNGANNTSLIITDDPDYFYPQANSRTPSLLHAKSGMMSKIYYPTGGNTSFEYELNQEGNVYAPGIRVKKIKDYDPVSGQTLETNYEYQGLVGGITFPYMASVKLTWKHNCFEKSFNSEILNPEISIKNYGYNHVRTIKKGPSLAEDLVHDDFYNTADRKYDNSIHAVKIGEIDYKSTSTGLEKLSSKKYVFNYVEDRTAEVISYQSSGTHTQLTAGFPVCETIYDGVNPVGLWYSKEIFKVQQIDSLFSASGVVTEVTNYLYEDALNVRPTKLTKQLSDQSYTIQEIKYPTFYQGLTGLSNTSIGVKNLQNKHVYSEPVEVVFYHSPNNVNLTVSSANFYEYAAATPVLESVYRLPTNVTAFNSSGVLAGNILRSADYQLYAKMLAYDSRGNLLSARRNDGIKTSYLYNAFNQITAAATNAGVNDIAYTSFDQNEQGGWNLNTTAITSGTTAISGTRIYDLSVANISKSNLDASIPYVVSYWSSGGPATISGTTAQAIHNFGGWVRYTHVVNAGVTNISISGNVLLDELSLYPYDAQMTTNFYEPNMGIRLSTDAKGMLTFYEYDDFNRLKLIKDHNGDIVKSYDYHYKP